MKTLRRRVRHDAAPLFADVAPCRRAMSRRVSRRQTTVMRRRADIRHARVQDDARMRVVDALTRRCAAHKDNMPRRDAA